MNGKFSVLLYMPVIINRMKFLGIIFLVSTINALVFQPIGFNIDQIKIVKNAISHWNNDGPPIEKPYDLLQLGISKNKLINTMIPEPSDVGYTVTRLYKKSTQYDVVIDVAKCKYENVFYNILLHEFGHVLELKHNANPLSIMNITIHLDSKYNGIDMEKKQLGLIDRCIVLMKNTVY